MLGLIIGLIKRVPRSWWIGVAAIVAGIALAVFVQGLRHERDAALVAASNAEAKTDSLRVVGIWHENVLYARLALQGDTVAGLRSALKKEKGRTAALTAILARPRAVDTTHAVANTGPVLADSIVGPPVDVKATVTVRPDSALWDWHVHPSAIPLTVDVGCLGRLKPDVVVSAPPWVTLDSVNTNVKTGVCGSVTPRTGKKVARTGLLVVLAFLGGWLVGGR